MESKASRLVVIRFRSVDYREVAAGFAISWPASTWLELDRFVRVASDITASEAAKELRAGWPLTFRLVVVRNNDLQLRSSGRPETTAGSSIAGAIFTSPENDQPARLGSHRNVEATYLLGKKGRIIKSEFSGVVWPATELRKTGPVLHLSFTRLDLN